MLLLPCLPPSFHPHFPPLSTFSPSPPSHSSFPPSRPFLHTRYCTGGVRCESTTPQHTFFRKSPPIPQALPSSRFLPSPICTPTPPVIALEGSAVSQPRPTSLMLLYWLASLPPLPATTVLLDPLFPHPYRYCTGGVRCESATPICGRNEEPFRSNKEPNSLPPLSFFSSPPQVLHWRGAL
ncbi:unnamed protein product [Closterium sp. NIES-53]